MDASASVPAQRADTDTYAVSAGLLQELADLLLQSRERIQQCLAGPPAAATAQPATFRPASAHAPPLVRQQR